MENMWLKNSLNKGTFLTENDDKKPILLMMVGLPASGKSALAKHIKSDTHSIYIDTDENKTGDFIIRSSDDLREKMFGSAECQTDNNKLFAELHKQIISDLRSGMNVIYDATNISKKLRRAFLTDTVKDIAKKVCVAVMTSHFDCYINNESRERQVPESVISKMLKNWQPPNYSDGFDDIAYVFMGNIPEFKYVYQVLFERINSFDQCNVHHKHSLGEHCMLAYQYCEDHYKRPLLSIAALLHDIGKEYTKTDTNSKGVIDGNAHYFQHHCVGAYLSLFYLAAHELDRKSMTYVSNLIYYHMHPFMTWQSEKAMQRDRRSIGETMFNDVMCLHEADTASQ